MSKSNTKETVTENETAEVEKVTVDETKTTETKTETVNKTVEKVEKITPDKDIKAVVPGSTGPAVMFATGGNHGSKMGVVRYLQLNPKPKVFADLLKAMYPTAVMYESEWDATYNALINHKV